MNDRSLRHIVNGLGGTTSGVPRETGFDITAASEIMAILCLAEDLEDLKTRLGNIFVGYTYDKQPIYARDLNAQGAMAMLLKDALQPNLVQTLEGTPALIHGGPFANIAQGTNTVIATKMAMSHSEYVVTEAGFGFDLGAEKFMDIKCVSAGLKPDSVVLVATIRALKYHGGQNVKELTTPNLEALKKGAENLRKHLENMTLFGVKGVVAINQFATDSEEEIAYVKSVCQEMDVAVELANVWGEGGKGAMSLAEEVVKAAESGATNFTPLYKWEWKPEDKMRTLATLVYGADGIEYSAKAKQDLKMVYDLGLDKLPICVAKTQKSLSDNPKLLGRPKGFTVVVRRIEIAAGAGFIIPITGEIMRMPGLPETPAAERMDVDNHGEITGLF